MALSGEHFLVLTVSEFRDFFSIRSGTLCSNICKETECDINDGFVAVCDVVEYVSLPHKF